MLEKLLTFKGMLQIVKVKTYLVRNKIFFMTFYLSAFIFARSVGEQFSIDEKKMPALKYIADQNECTKVKSHEKAI